MMPMPRLASVYQRSRAAAAYTGRTPLLDPAKMQTFFMFTSLGLDARLLHHLHPAHVLRLDEGAEFDRRHEPDLRTFLDQSLPDRRIVHDVGNGGVDLLHDVGGETLRRDEAAPGADVEIGHAPFGHRGNVGHGRIALVRCERD